MHKICNLIIMNYRFFFLFIVNILCVLALWVSENTQYNYDKQEEKSVIHDDQITNFMRFSLKGISLK